MTSHDLRCPQCSAHIIPGAEWCTLCFADLRPPPPVVEAPSTPAAPTAPAVVAGEPVNDPAPGPETTPAGGGKHARRETTYDDAATPTALPPVDPAAAAEIEARADEMLAMLAAESRSGLHPLSGRLATKQARVVASLAGGIGLVVLGVLVMTVLGLFV